MGMNKLIIGIFIVLVLVGGCLTLPSQDTKKNQTDELKFEEVTDFMSGYNEYMKIEKKHKANYKKEYLGGPLVPKERIKEFVKDIEILRTQVDPNRVDFENITTKKPKTEMDFYLLFLGFRVTMLKGEFYFQEGYKHGAAGLVGDGFYCTEKPLILESLDNFDKGVQNTIKAQYYLDLVLTGLPDQTWDLIGVEENKPKIYDTPLNRMIDQLKANRNHITKYCNGTDENKFITFETEEGV